MKEVELLQSLCYKPIMRKSTGSLALGIDIGTTKVAAVVVSPETRDVVASSSVAHNADIQGLPEGRSEQDPQKLLVALDTCIETLPVDARSAIGVIGLTGQMHGVVLWNPDNALTSHLITWQDQRCLHDHFIDELRKMLGKHPERYHPGFGAVTLAWLASRDSSTLRQFSRAATIHDYVAAKLTSSTVAHTDPSDAASWGFFDIRSREWDRESLQRAGISDSLIPSLRPAGHLLGTLSEHYSARWSLPRAVPVANALGDHQAALYGSLTAPSHQIALTIGTGAQLSVVVDTLPHSYPDGLKSHEYRPYVGDSYIATVASLSGGRSVAALGKALQQFIHELGIENPPTLDHIQTTMHEAGLKRVSTEVHANAAFGGERHSPDSRGSISNLTFDTFTIGDITSAMCHALVTGLKDALPPELLRAKTQVVGGGNAIHRSALMRQVIERAFGCPITLTPTSETTALGAALLAASAPQRH